MNRNTIIANCKKYLGRPYVWGGESMAEGGYDCSGYVYNVLRDSGYSVNRTTAQGYSKLGKAVPYSKAGISDLLFFGKSASAITHIAIYAGNGNMYESIGGSKNTKNNPGKGVSLSKVSRRNDLILVKSIMDDVSDGASKLNTAVINDYKVGNTYTLQAEMKVRKGAGTNYAAKTHSMLTKDGQKHDTDGDGALDKGTKVTCKAIKKVGKDTWMKIPSGWIAAIYNGKVYVK